MFKVWRGNTCRGEFKTRKEAGELCRKLLDMRTEKQTRWNMIKLTDKNGMVIWRG